MASGSYYQVHVGCPFYIADEPEQKRICCEAITKAELPARRQFRRREDYENCLRDYCCENYRYCEHYRMLMAFKYAE